MGLEQLAQTAALVVREYLHSKGYSRTLDIFDTEAKISYTEKFFDAVYLARILDIEKLAQRNKDDRTPLSAVLEIILKYFIDRSSSKAHSNQRLPLIHADSPLSRDAFAGSKDASYRTKHRPPTDSTKSDLLILEDDIESDTIAGGGRSNLLQKVADIEDSFKARRLTSKAASLQPKGSPTLSSERDSSGQKEWHFKKPHYELSTGTPSLQWDSLEQTTELDLLQRRGDGIPARRSAEHATGVPGHTTLLNSSEPRLPESEILFSEKADQLLTTKVNDLSESISVQSSSGRPRSAAPQHSLNSGKALRPAGYQLQPDGSGSSNISADHLHEQAVSTGQSLGAATEGYRSAGERCSSSLLVKGMDDRVTVPWRMTESISTSNGLQGLLMDTPAGSRPISIQMAVELKKVVLGSALLTFTEEWLMQAFCFSDVPPVEYGLMCNCAGLNPLIAAVQATFLQEMLFGAGHVGDARQLRPTKDERTLLLSQCLSKALWRAGGGKQATLVLPCYQNAISGGGRYKADGITEQLIVLNFDKKEELDAAVLMHMDMFSQEGRGGAIALLYSLVLSRGIDNIIGDIGGEQSSLLLNNGTICTQNVIFLITAGHATMDDIILKHATTSNSIQARVPRSAAGRLDVGFLSLDEFYKRCHVGSRMKTPRYPVWLVHINGRHSVLFSVKHQLVTDWKAERRFDLYYYDPLGRQDYEIRLTIDTTSSSNATSSDDDNEEIPPLELCIATKWAGAAVHWNDVKPLH